MSPETACQQVLEELLSRRSPTGELAAHLASCPTCQQAVRTLQGLGSLPSVWTTPPSAVLQQKIMKSVAEAGLLKPASPLSSPESRLPGNVPAGSLTATSFTIALAGGVLVLALFFNLPHRSRKSSGQVPRPDQVASEAVSLASETRSLASPALAPTLSPTGSPASTAISAAASSASIPVLPPPSVDAQPAPASFRLHLGDPESPGQGAGSAQQ